MWRAQGCASRGPPSPAVGPTAQQVEVPAEALLQLLVDVAQLADLGAGDPPAVAQGGLVARQGALGLGEEALELIEPGVDGGAQAVADAPEAARVAEGPLRRPPLAE